MYPDSALSVPCSRHGVAAGEWCDPLGGRGTGTICLGRIFDAFMYPDPIAVVPPEPQWSPYPWPFGRHRDYYDREAT